MTIETLIIKYQTQLKEWEGYQAQLYNGDIQMSYTAQAKVKLLREIIADLCLLRGNCNESS